MSELTAVILIAIVLVAVRMVYLLINRRFGERDFLYCGLVTIFLVVMLAMQMPIVNPSREPARRINCSGNLQQIGLALLIYAHENDGFFPSGQEFGGNDLGILSVQGYLPDGKVYGCPSRVNVSSVASKMDYIYIGSGLKNDNENPKTTPLAFDYPDNHPGRMWFNILFIDGHVEGYEMNKWEAVTGLKIDDELTRR